MNFYLLIISLLEISCLGYAYKQHNFEDHPMAPLLKIKPIALDPPSTDDGNHQVMGIPPARYPPRMPYAGVPPAKCPGCDVQGSTKPYEPPANMPFFGIPPVQYPPRLPYAGVPPVAYPPRIPYAGVPPVNYPIGNNPFYGLPPQMLSPFYGIPPVNPPNKDYFSGLYPILGGPSRVPFMYGSLPVNLTLPKQPKLMNLISQSSLVKPIPLSPTSNAICPDGNISSKTCSPGLNVFERGCGLFEMCLYDRGSGAYGCCKLSAGTHIEDNQKIKTIIADEWCECVCNPSNTLQSSGQNVNATVTD